MAADRTEKPTIYLVANNMNPSNELINHVRSTNFKDSDIIVVFNTANSPLVKLLPRLDIACFRYNGGGTKSFYFGVDSDLSITSSVNRAKKFFFLNDPDGTYVPPIVAKNQIESRYEVHSHVPYRIGGALRYGDIVYQYVKGTAPTSGMFYIFHFLNNYPEYNLELLGFNLKGMKDNLHPFSKEVKLVEEFCKLDRVRNII